MNNINKTLYIPLYGKAYVSKKGMILDDKKAEELWNKHHIPLKGKSKSKWLAYFMAMRAKVFDNWVLSKVKEYPDSIILHLGCGLDSRNQRVNIHNLFYDIDFKEVIDERKIYYNETDTYKMIAGDLKEESWLKDIPNNQHVIIVMEGVSMYLSHDDLKKLFDNFDKYFKSISFMMDCYSEKAAKLSKHKNPINDVGVYDVYGIDEPHLFESNTFKYLREHNMTPDHLINELQGLERKIFKSLYAGKFSNSLYKIYEYKK